MITENIFEENKVMFEQIREPSSFLEEEKIWRNLWNADSSPMNWSSPITAFRFMFSLEMWPNDANIYLEESVGETK